MTTENIRTLEEALRSHGVIVSGIAMTAARDTRYKAPYIETRQTVFDAPKTESGVRVQRVEITTDGEYVVNAKVLLVGITGKYAAGHGTTVKGRQDRFSAFFGATKALKRAFRVAFNVLGQREGGPVLKRGESPMDSLMLDGTDQTGWIGLQLLNLPSKGRK